LPPDPSVIAGPYLRDILDQPAALERTLEKLQPLPQLQNLRRLLRAGKFQRVVLTGMGGSLHALYPLRLELIDHGLTAMMVETSELVHYERRLLDSKTLLVVVSQSGQSAETVTLIKKNHGRVPLIAVTNTPGSPLARLADAAVLTDAGQEFSVSCKTYTTALMALKWLAAILCGKDQRRTRRDLGKVAPAARAYLADWESHVRDLSKRFAGVDNLFLVGRGESLAAAATGGLIVKESAHLHAEGMSSAAFRHGPFEMLGPKTSVLIFSGDAATRKLNQKLAQDIRANRGRVEMTGERAGPGALQVPAVPKGVRPVVEILPVHMLTLALAALAGREPGRFTFVSKITTDE
jgi:glutamine---fructose-6-phosphate transaminase (isomerizing)